MTGGWWGAQDDVVAVSRQYLNDWIDVKCIRNQGSGRLSHIIRPVAGFQQWNWGAWGVAMALSSA